ncbi:peptidylprolyl isomerase [Paenibacillus macerans]|uniref:peptidylprolyl isomerase n=1 Tax=Paenibacillus macerans TaxID=44252 RepID=UPI00203D249A|nr:peptidylprolyl isomerase [Paenibacillus macerans]MCM3703871.1 peptidylprolyl isomerase [Paenibacillus macerans]
MFQSKRRSWRTLLIALVAVLAFSIMAGCGKKDVVATYEGGEITAKEFDLDQRILLAVSPQAAQLLQMDEFREYLLKQEIAYKYLAAKADDKTAEAGKKKAEQQLEMMKASYGGADAFKKMLDAQKVSEAEVKDYFNRLYIAMENEENKVTEDDMKKEFEAAKENFTTASVRHILIGFTDPGGKQRSEEETLKLAKDIKARLDKGEDFATLAKKYSEDPGSKDNGGLYENANVSGWVEEFKQAALTQPVNKIGDPVKTSYGYHIIRVESRNEKKYEDFTQDEKDQLKMSAASKKVDEFMTGDLEKKIIKKINLPKVETPKDNGGNATNNGAGAGSGAGTGTNAGTGTGTNAGTDGSGNAGASGNGGGGAANNAGTSGTGSGNAGK